MVILFIPIECIIGFLIVVLSLIGGPNALAVVTVMLNILFFAFIISGVASLILLFASEKKIITRIFNSIIIVLITFALCILTNSYKEELLSLFNEDWFEYIIDLVLVGIMYVLYIIIGGFATLSLVANDENPLKSIVLTIIFIILSTSIFSNMSIKLF